MTSNNKNLPFIDLLAQKKAIGEKLDTTILDVMNSGQFIMGPAISDLEEKLAKFTDAKHVLACGSGTDALMMPLMAWGIGPGDAVFVPSFTFIATAEVVGLVGATPIFCDVLPDSYNLDSSSLVKGIEKAKSLGLTPKAVIPVDLFGLPADFTAIEEISSAHNLLILDDFCQGFGGVYKGKTLGSIGDAGATSFFPAKPLGCYGDGGAVFTNDEELYKKMSSIRVHGQGDNRYHNVRLGLNARMDTIQAAILLHKLEIFPEELQARNKIALRYNKELKDFAIVPKVPEELQSCWAQYTLRIPSVDRQKFADYLKSRGIPTAIYYPIPLHKQPGYGHYPSATESLSVCEKICDEVISLPMHPYLKEEDQGRVINAIKSFMEGNE
jgi:dTDP-4-amino-4,6-dideoxygalactose transaminase